MGFRLLGVLFVALALLPSSAFSQSTAANSKQCSACYKEKTGFCQKRCESVSSPQGQQLCTDGCVKSSCVTTCGAFGDPNKAKKAEGDGELESPPVFVNSGGSAFKEHSGECGICLRRQEFGECRLRCSKDKVENVTLCRRKCAKGMCANKCSLPAKEVRRKNKRITKEDCGDCKTRSRTYCYDRCGDNTERPGYTTCHVSCIQERCLEICNPEPQ